MAFLQDTRPPYEPLLNAPASVLWLIGVLLATHAVRVLLPGDWPDILLAEFAFIPARYAGSPDFAGDTLIEKIVPFVSHIFVHGGIAHVGINSLWLLAFGPLVARRLKTLKFLLFFLFCGIAGALVHLVTYWGSMAAVVGASGAIAGLMGASMRMVYGRLYNRRLAPIFSSQIVGFSLIWTVVNVVSGVIGFGAGENLMLVAWVVHLGGYFAGLLSIGVFDRIASAQRLSRDLKEL